MIKKPPKKNRRMDGSASMVAELHAALGKMEIALGVVREGIAWTDLDGKIQWCNFALDRMLRRPHIELLGARLMDMMPLKLAGSDVSPQAHPVSRALGSKPRDGESYALRIGKRTQIVEIYWEHVSFGDHTTSIVFMVMDVTKRKEIERRRLALSRQLAISNKELSRSNADLGLFAAAVSHDLQEPLRKIVSFGDLLEKHLAAGLDETGRTFLQHMRGAATRMSNLIQSILQLSQVTKDTEPFESIPLNTVLSDVLKDLEIQIKESRAEIDVGALPSVHGHPAQMRQLFQNLIGNAVKFCRKGEAPRIVLSSRIPAKGFVEISVADNGIGFDEKYAEKIFQPFRRLNPTGEFKGSGLGLAICRSIVIRHGGKIAAKSAPGAGAAFLVTLPAAKA